MTSRSCAAAMSRPPAAAISTTATNSPTWRVKTESMSSSSVSAVSTRIADLRDGGVAARGEERVRRHTLKPAPLNGGIAHSAAPQPSDTEQSRNSDAQA